VACTAAVPLAEPGNALCPHTGNESSRTGHALRRQRLIKSAIRDNNPVLFLEHKFLYRRIKEEVPETDYIIPIGKARLHRAGRDLSIITYAAMSIRRRKPPLAGQGRN